MNAFQNHLHLPPRANMLHKLNRQSLGHELFFKKRKIGSFEIGVCPDEVAVGCIEFPEGVIDSAAELSFAHQAPEGFWYFFKTYFYLTKQLLQ